MQVIRKGMQGEKRIEVRFFRRMRKETNKLGFVEVLAPPLGELSAKLTERVYHASFPLSVTAYAVPAPPEGEPRALHASPPTPNLSLSRAKLIRTYFSRFREKTTPQGASEGDLGVLPYGYGETQIPKFLPNPKENAALLGRSAAFSPWIRKEFGNVCFTMTIW